MIVFLAISFTTMFRGVKLIIVFSDAVMNVPVIARHKSLCGWFNFFGVCLVLTTFYHKSTPYVMINLIIVANKQYGIRRFRSQVLPITAPQRVSCFEVFTVDCFSGKRYYRSVFKVYFKLLVWITILLFESGSAEKHPLRSPRIPVALSNDCNAI